jgi:hypothetical protein
MKQNIIFVLIASLLLYSCEKEVLFKSPRFEELLVVEGRIETGQPPFILLTRNSSYYGKTSLTDVMNTFVHGAIIKVSDGIDTVTLTELTFDTAGVSISIYTDPTFFFDSSLTKIKGKPNTTYYLWVEAEGKKVNAVTTIPTSYPLDSVWYKTDVVKNRSDLVRLICRYSDPPELGQYVRYFTKRNNGAFLPGYNSVFDDNIINGTTLDFPLDRGVNRNDTAVFTDYGYFYKGDTIVVKWSNIDYTSYKFFRTLEFELNSGGPFSSPVIVQGKINGGLGSWVGYNNSFKTLIIPQ